MADSKIHWLTTFSADHFFKAAYFKDGAYSLYPNGTDTAPILGTEANFSPSSGLWAVGTGTAEQNGTYDMAGNVYEWCEDGYRVDRRYLLGGSIHHYEVSSRSDSWVDWYFYEQGSHVGFRVVAVPEPASAMMLVFGVGVGLAVHRARRAAMRR